MSLRILVAIDESDSGRHIFEQLARFRWSEPPAITLLNVVDTADLPDAIGRYPGAYSRLKSTLKSAAERRLMEHSDLVQRMSWETSTRCREGHAAEEILEQLEADEFDVVALGTRGMEGFSGFLLGSVSSQVLSHAPCSVLLVRPSPFAGTSAQRPLRILLATDGSEDSRKAVAKLASSGLANGSEMLLMRVVTVVTAFRMDIIQELSEAWNDEKQAAEADLEEARRQLESVASSVMVKMREGPSAAQEILDEMEDFEPDLLVMGNKGTNAIGRFLKGSVSRRVARRASCTVLIVKS